MTHNKLSTNDAWRALRSATSARIALGRAGGSLPTRAWLDFRHAHAAARDAVHHAFDADLLADQIRSLEYEAVVVSSRAYDRTTFLQRPDLGRQLDDAALLTLSERKELRIEHDLVIVVSDGLSAMAIHRQTIPLLAQLLPKLRRDRWTLSSIVIVRFGRVAIEDAIGELIGARIALILIGERPGLGSPDSLGAYLVYSPERGKTDAERNCVSNIRSAGLTHEAAAETICYLLTESRRRQLSGIQLKDERKATTAVFNSTTSDSKAIT